MCTRQPVPCEVPPPPWKQAALLCPLPAPDAQGHHRPPPPRVSPCLHSCLPESVLHPSLFCLFHCKPHPVTLRPKTLLQRHRGPSQDPQDAHKLALPPSVMSHHTSSPCGPNTPAPLTHSQVFLSAIQHGGPPPPPQRGIGHVNILMQTKQDVLDA